MCSIAIKRGRLPSHSKQNYHETTRKKAHACKSSDQIANGAMHKLAALEILAVLLLLGLEALYREIRYRYYVYYVSMAWHKTVK